MAQSNFKKLLPYLLIVAAFALISVVYFYPALQGKVLSAGDNVSWRGMSHESSEWAKKTGEDVLWSNSMFGGMPTYTTYLPSNNNFVAPIQYALKDILNRPAYFLFLGMLSFFILMRVLRVNKWLGVVGAIAFAFSTFNIVLINAGHDTEVLALAYVPGIIAGFILIYRGRYWTGAALMGLALTLQISNSHYQVSYYTIAILGFAFLGMLISAAKNGTWAAFLKSSVLAVIIGVISVAPCAPGIFATREYEKVTMRAGRSELTKKDGETNKKNGGLDKDYAFEWSNGVAETFTMLLPYLYGGASGEDASHMPATFEATGERAETLPAYWGPQNRGISGPVYYGAVICFLFVLGLMIVKSPHKWWMLAVSVLAIMMSWGSNFQELNYWLFDHVPMLNKFRTPSMILVIPLVMFPIIAILAIQELIQDGNTEEMRKALWKKVTIAAGITAGLALLLGVGGSMFFSYTNPIRDKEYGQIISFLKEDRAAMARNSGLLSALYIVMAAGILWAFLKGKITKLPLIVGIGLIIAIDLIPVAHRYLSEKNFADPEEYANIFTPRPADQQVWQMAGNDPYYRVLDVTRDPYNDAVPAYFHKLVGGYHPAKMEIYQDLIGAQMNGQSYNSEVLNMLNTRFLIVPAGQQGEGAQVIPNPNAAGNAWFVSNIKVVKSADEEMASLNAPRLGDTSVPMPGQFKAKETAVIRDNFMKGMESFVPGRDSGAGVKLAKYGLDQISYQSTNSKDGLAVFSDIWYPLGWKAYVDGKEVPILRANYVLRALRLPAGNHEIVFKFHPDTFYNGKKIALIGSLLIYALLIAALYMGWKYWQRQQKDQIA